MPRMYPVTVRRQVISRLRSGESVAVAPKPGFVRPGVPIALDRSVRFHSP
jgi:hypothetical protein